MERKEGIYQSTYPVTESSIRWFYITTVLALPELESTLCEILRELWSKIRMKFIASPRSLMVMIIGVAKRFRY